MPGYTRHMIGRKRYYRQQTYSETLSSLAAEPGAILRFHTPLTDELGLTTIDGDGSGESNSYFSGNVLTATGHLEPYGKVGRTLERQRDINIDVLSWTVTKAWCGMWVSFTQDAIDEWKGCAVARWYNGSFTSDSGIICNFGDFSSGTCKFGIRAGMSTGYYEAEWRPNAAKQAHFLVSTSECVDTGTGETNQKLYVDGALVSTNTIGGISGNRRDGLCGPLSTSTNWYLDAGRASFAWNTSTVYSICHTGFFLFTGFLPTDEQIQSLHLAGRAMQGY